MPANSNAKAVLLEMAARVADDATSTALQDFSGHSPRELRRALQDIENRLGMLESEIESFCESMPGPDRGF